MKKYVRRGVYIAGRGVGLRSAAHVNIFTDDTTEAMVYKGHSHYIRYEVRTSTPLPPHPAIRMGVHILRMLAPRYTYSKILKIPW